MTGIARIDMTMGLMILRITMQSYEIIAISRHKGRPLCKDIDHYLLVPHKSMSALVLKDERTINDCHFFVLLREKRIFIKNYQILSHQA